MFRLHPMACSVLLIGGCTEREESGCLRSIEELSLSCTPTGVNIATKVVGHLQEARRSPAVFRERNGVVVLGGCLKKNCHLASGERIQRNGDQWECTTLVFSDVIDGRSCAVSFNLGKSVGAVIGGYNGIECSKKVQLVRLNEKELSSTTLHDIPFRLKNSVGVALPDGAVLLFGGWDERHTMKTVFRLNFNACFTSYQIEMESILPYDVEGHCCALYGDHVYLVGGYDGVSVTDKIVRYSISNRSSEVLPTRLSIARENHACEVLLDRYLVVMGGWDGKKALDSIEVFELTNEHPYLVSTNVEFKLSQARIRPASVVVC
ncbi:hypothetical protein KIN20_013734 [Parelaphostrongylus tenuis]|uniref:Uncharacterized protein n=1 Tax=Parelaphostrongylus tenuis TaxID=148309 RepID=A0AAD5QL75_PARTN|nr:hypothetical protein KIN20_013734 [Parelaphostrongylus tenuis]